MLGLKFLLEFLDVNFIARVSTRVVRTDFDDVRKVEIDLSRALIMQLKWEDPIYFCYL